MIYKELRIEPNTYIKDPEFSKKIKSAIDLLDSKANAEFLVVKKYTKVIRAAQSSGANYNEKEMTIDIGQATFDASLEWLASVFAHENHHLKKFKDTGKKYGNAHLMEDKKKALQVMIDEELECNGVQLIVLKKIGGTAAEIDYLGKQKGDHFDVNKDGVYDEKDYGSRSW
jgi:hypothetical protein